MDWITVAFLVGGILLIASEVVQLSLVSLALGLSALLVAGLRGTGVIDDVAVSFLVWSIASVVLALPLRPLARRYLKTGDARVDHSHEDDDAMGQIVDVVEEIDDVSNRGRVRFLGTTWVAQSLSGVIPKGGKAKLMVKDKAKWLVEPLDALDDVNAIPSLDQEQRRAQGQGGQPQADQLEQHIAEHRGKK